VCQRNLSKVLFCLLASETVPPDTSRGSSSRMAGSKAEEQREFVSLWQLARDGKKTFVIIINKRLHFFTGFLWYSKQTSRERKRD
jgi:hypothetical protein